jgi:cyclophilin family peptidyl-prolyl cis-trans isomerase
MKLLQTLFLAIVITLTACTQSDNKNAEVTRTKVEMTTNYGTVILELYNETPKHRDNFIKIVNDGVLDSLLFHRVIESFMIQAGDINSKNASPMDTLGNGDLGYLVDAEIDTAFFHKKGAIGAARSNNPARASSSTQFYITQGKVLNDSLLDRAETRINGWLAENIIFNKPEHEQLRHAFNLASKEENWEAYGQIMDSVKQMAETLDFDKYVIPTSHRAVYKTIGGTPHLDQNYTVFGEVISGMEVVDTIAATQTGQFDRPVSDVRILKVRIVN